MAQWFYQFRQHIFRYFVIICIILGKVTNANSFTQECFEPSLIEIGPLVLEKILKFCPCIFHNLLLYPLGKWVGSSFEQIRIPFSKKWFVPSLVDIIPVVIVKKIFFFNLVNVFYDASLLSPHGKGHGHSFEQTWTPFTQGCSVFSISCQVVLEKKMKSLQTDRQTNRRTDGEWQVIKQEAHGLYRSHEKTAQIDKHMIISLPWLREKKPFI